MSEKLPEYVTDALEMINHPSTIIEPPRKTLARKTGEGFEERDEPAWIKFSTAFKTEMPSISSNALKVWIYIALSVNYKGEAFPSIKTIANGVGLSHVTVLSDIKELENGGLLTVRRGEKRHNIYEITDDYVKIGRGEPVKNLYQSETVSKENAPIGIDSDKTSKDVFTLTRDNKIQQEIIDSANKTVDAVLRAELSPKAIQDAIRTHFQLIHRWENKYERQWMQWAMEEGITPELIEVAARRWKFDKTFNWQQPSLKKIQEHWLALISESQPPDDTPAPIVGARNYP
jgi:hypothetical protein